MTIVTCDHCGEEFDDLGERTATGGAKAIMSLFRHIKKEHPPEDKPAPVRAGPMWYPCPVCLYRTPRTDGAMAYRFTVCPICLAKYDRRTGILDDPPPEYCVAERKGLPCPQPQHKVYYSRYKESLT